MLDRTGTQIGRYRLLRFLGSGNFADVYLGQHLLLGSYAAIKILRARLTQKDLNDFLREARLVANLIHPHIVRTFDCDVEKGIPYLVLDYASRGTLRQKYSREARLSPEEVLSYLKQIADGLQYAHNQQIVHRDIKPENLFLGPKGEIMVGDFSGVLIAQNSRLQSMQNIVGTAAYIAPEQIQGKPKFASDQYALGVVTYEWLTGERPFSGNFTEIIGQHMVTPPAPLRTKVADLSPAIEQVVLTALAKDPHQRFPSVQAFAQTFEQACQDKSHTWSMRVLPDPSYSLPSPASSQQLAYLENNVATRPNVPSFTTSTNTLSSPSIPPLRAHLASQVQTSSYTSPFKIHHVYQGHSGPVRSLAWSADSQLLASGGEDASLHLWQAGSGRLLISYPGHDGPVHATGWSPQDMLLASGCQDATVRIWFKYLPRRKEDQHLFRRYDSPGPVVALAWSPTDLLLASCDLWGVDVLIWEVDGWKPLTSYRSQGGKINALAWSPNGARLAAACASGMVQIWQLGSSEPEHLYQSAANNLFALAWSPNGKALAFAGDEKMIHVWQWATEHTVAHYAGHQQPVRSLTWSPDSRFLVSSSSDRTVRIWDVTGRNLLIYTGHTNDVTAVAWSPDGRLLASAGLDSTVHVWQPHPSSLH